MAHEPHAAGTPEVPEQLIAERRAGWHAFTQGIVFNCIGTAAVLLLLLLVFKVF